ncbi:MAG: hypothetical protein ABSB74_19595, partial [Tepidisphaeraceae bacterium]
MREWLLLICHKKNGRPLYFMLILIVLLVDLIALRKCLRVPTKNSACLGVGTWDGSYQFTGERRLVMLNNRRIATVAGLTAAVGIFSSTPAHGSVVIGTWTSDTSDQWIDWSSQSGYSGGATSLPTP